MESKFHHVMTRGGVSYKGEQDTLSPRQKKRKRMVMAKLITRQREHGPGAIPITELERVRLMSRSR